MTQPPEPYLPRHIEPLGTWRLAGHAIKAYGIHHAPAQAAPLLTDAIATAARAAVGAALEEQAQDPRGHGLGFCMVHVGQEAVWLLVDWWITGGIVCQRMLSAPLARPEAFTPVTAPALACVWELVVTAHERDAWVRHMLTARPDAPAYLADVLPPGRY
ncbi:hypothetical protein [Achromobacter xylosoxidans]|uniref:Uncharacterized protein n=1 Tax=Alcaligenes xylosoxydans xylosoxydans TaxID=85698 RepID=A0A0X8P2W6_ALCXX|nr:hypothetical protein [Achromobacter xylosoxidans]AMG38799.1 hypothetical protein AL504_23885 [Achromobacter xylosoxidans]